MTNFLPYVFILSAALLRLVPHPWNFVPVAAMAMFGGAYLNKKWAVVLPLVAMIVSDFYIGFDSAESRLAVYGCFVVSSLIGLYIRNHKNFATIVGGSILGSLIFFLVTNFVWLHSTSLYPHSVEGLIASYTNALPFFKNTLLGDLFYTGVLFGSYELVRSGILKYHNLNYKSQEA
jgi:hypothetical protein